jgi:hypothetical protein
LRKLVIDRPNHVWCADVTYIPMRRGFLYLVAVMDWKPPCNRSPSRANLKSPFASACSGAPLSLRLPIAAVPQHDRTTAILTP